MGNFVSNIFFNDKSKSHDDDKEEEEEEQQPEEKEPQPEENVESPASPTHREKLQRKKSGEELFDKFSQIGEQKKAQPSESKFK